MEYNIKIQDSYSIADCNENPRSLYIYGDNCTFQGMRGQAIIRNCHNSRGLCTKMSISEFMSDTHYKQNTQIIDDDISVIQDWMKRGNYNTLVLPSQGLGTGLAHMQKKCPKTFIYLCTRLLEEFQFNNMANLVTKF